MTRFLHLTITTPSTVLVDASEVESVRAEDAGGGFGILPGHADLLTVLPASVIRWRRKGEIVRFCALRSGILTVRGGLTVVVACRQGTVGSDLTKLEAEVKAMQHADAEVDRQARVEQMRLHARAVRQLIRYLKPGYAAAGEQRSEGDGA